MRLNKNPNPDDIRASYINKHLRKNVRKFGFVLLHFLDLFLAKNGIYFNPFLGFYISFIPKRCYSLGEDNQNERERIYC